MRLAIWLHSRILHIRTSIMLLRLKWFFNELFILPPEQSLHIIAACRHRLGTTEMDVELDAALGEAARLIRARRDADEKLSAQTRAE